MTPLTVALHPLSSVRLSPWMKMVSPSYTESGISATDARRSRASVLSRSRETTARSAGVSLWSFAHHPLLKTWTISTRMLPAATRESVAQHATKMRVCSPFGKYTGSICVRFGATNAQDCMRCTRGPPAFGLCEMPIASICPTDPSFTKMPSSISLAKRSWSWSFMAPLSLRIASACRV